MNRPLFGCACCGAILNYRACVEQRTATGSTFTCTTCWRHAHPDETARVDAPLMCRPEMAAR